MLVTGQTRKGTLRSSYAHTMGFGVSARAVMETTRSKVAYPLISSIKSITYSTNSGALKAPPGGCYGQ